ncbi:MAG TPA: YDG domain-containing protein, partial [Caulobacteraceae bacterium]|nr:YDG domain-containing protein [Caulobacteraceae bacterium]
TAGGGGIVVNSYATGAVSVGAYPAGGIDSPDAGGLVGEFGGSGDNDHPATGVAGSYATGAVSGGAGSSIGGLIGSLGDVTVTTSYATGAVTQSGGGVSGSNSAAGGFVGSVDQGAQIGLSYASGDVSSVGAASGAFTRAGGFAGQVEDPGTSISEAYALGSVNVTGSAGTNTSGGFAGAIDNDASIDHVYATGLVTGGAGVATAGLVAQVGSTDGTFQTGGSIADSYWDQGTTGQTTGANAGSSFANVDSITAVGGSGPSAYAQASYANFDFGSTWFIVEGSTRPILQSEYSTDITNAHQLQLVDLNLGANYTLGADIDASATGGASDIWNPMTGFSPIGATLSSAFTGQLDGQGHSITNLTVIGTSTPGQMGSSGQPSDGAAGLFGFVGSGGVIQNLNLVNANVSGGDGMEVGALAGDVAGTVTNVTSSGMVTVGDGDEGFSADARAGGLVGDLTGTIQNSSSSATVSGGQASVGGLVGELEGGTILTSFATGAVSVGTDSEESEIPVAGGLVGSALVVDGEDGAGFPSISGSYATGAVTAGGGSIAGGFIGLSQGEITTSYATGSVTQAASPNSQENEAGGFAGEVAGGEVSQSFATGAVTVAGSGTTAEVGGFVGALTNGEISDAYATGAVMVTNSSSGSSDEVGGFAGFVATGGQGNVYDINNVYATGAVSARGSVGGIAGENDGVITNGYWDEVTTNQSAGVGSSHSGTSDVTGLVDGTSTDPFTQSTYDGFDFNIADYGHGESGVWSIPSEGEFPQLYGVSHVITFTATALNNAPIVYGNYPVYTVVATGLQGGDTYESAVKTLQVQPLDPNNDNAPPSVGLSGYYDANSYQPFAYDLSIADNAAAKGPSGVYRPVFTDNIATPNPPEVTNFDGTLTITPAPLTVAAVPDQRPFDGGTDSSRQPMVAGLVPGDQSGNPTQSFDDPNASPDNILIRVNSFTVDDGNGGANYAVSTTNAYGEIDPELLTAVIVAPVDKTYDGTTNATLSEENYSLSGAFVGDDVGVSGPTGADSGQYSDKNVGTGIQVTAEGVSLTGDTSNYTLVSTEATGNVGEIDPAQLTLAAVTDSKTYDGNTLSSAMPSVTGLVSGDSIDVTQSFAGKNAGSELLSVDPGFVITDGNGGNNYIVDSSGTAQGTIFQKALTAGLTGSVEKIYDGTTTATLTDENYLPLSGVVKGDQVSLNDPTSGLYSDKNAATGKAVSVSGLMLSGEDAANYTVNGTAQADIGTITPAPLTLTALTETRTYDGTAASDVTPANSALAEGDSLSGLTETFDSRNAGSRTLSVSGFTIDDGNGGGNYAVTEVSAPGTINPAPLTLAAVADSKTYDGGVLSSATPTESGLVAGDSISGLAETYDSKDAGTRTLSVGGYTIDDGNGGGNYIVTTTIAPGTIDQKALTASLVGTVSKPFDGDTDATLANDNYSLAGVVSGDQVSLNDPASGSYDTPNAGFDKLVSVDGLALSGADAANYTVNETAAAQIGTITAPPPVVTNTPPPVVINLPPLNLASSGFAQATAAASSAASGPTNVTTTVVNVFPVVNVNNSSNYGDNTPITGAGNRDLWTGSDESSNGCPTGASPPCSPSGGGHP